MSCQQNLKICVHLDLIMLNSKYGSNNMVNNFGQSFKHPLWHNESL